MYVRKRTVNKNTLTSRVSVRVGTAGMGGGAAPAATAVGGGGSGPPIIVQNTLPDTLLQRLTRIEDGLATRAAPAPVRSVADAGTNTIAFVSEDGAPVSSSTAATQTGVRTANTGTQATPAAVRTVNRGVQFAPTSTSTGTIVVPDMRTQGTQVESSTRNSSTQTRIRTRGRSTQAGSTMASTGVSTSPADVQAPPPSVPMLVDAPHATGTPSGALLPSLPGHPQQPAHYVNGPGYVNSAANEWLKQLLAAAEPPPAASGGGIKRKKPDLTLPPLLPEYEEPLPPLPESPQDVLMRLEEQRAASAAPPAPPAVDIRPSAFRNPQPASKKAKIAVPVGEADVLQMAKKTAKLLKGYGKSTEGIDKVIRDLLAKRITKAQAKPLVKQFRRTASDVVTDNVIAGTPAPRAFAFPDP